MARKSKYVGSVVFFLIVDRNGRQWVLLHRRGAQEQHLALKVGPPWFLIPRAQCQNPDKGGLDLEYGAKQISADQVFEQTGIHLGTAEVASIKKLPTFGEEPYGRGTRLNFCLTFQNFPVINSPPTAFAHAWLHKCGMDGIGLPLGDHHHSWVPLHQLASFPDLVPGIREPLGAVALVGITSALAAGGNPFALNVDASELGALLQRRRQRRYHFSDEFFEFYGQGSKRFAYTASCAFFLMVDTRMPCPSVGVRKPGRFVLVHKRGQQMDPNEVTDKQFINDAEMVSVPYTFVPRDRYEKHDVANKQKLKAVTRQFATAALYHVAGVNLGNGREDIFKLTCEIGVTVFGAEAHRNYALVLEGWPRVGGPMSTKAKLELWERYWNRRAVGYPERDGYHCWVDIDELLGREDLAEYCVHPLRELARITQEVGKVKPSKVTVPRTEEVAAAAQNVSALPQGPRRWEKNPEFAPRSASAATVVAAAQPAETFAPRPSSASAATVVAAAQPAETSAPRASSASAATVGAAAQPAETSAPRPSSASAATVGAAAQPAETSAPRPSSASAATVVAAAQQAETSAPRPGTKRLAEQNPDAAPGAPVETTSATTGVLAVDAALMASIAYRTCWSEQALQAATRLESGQPVPVPLRRKFRKLLLDEAVAQEDNSQQSAADAAKKLANAIRTGS